MCDDMPEHAQQRSTRAATPANKSKFWCVNNKAGHIPSEPSLNRGHIEDALKLRLVHGS